MKQKRILMTESWLEPDMDYVMCGLTTYFRKKENDDRSFIDEKNADFTFIRRDGYRVDCEDGVWVQNLECPKCLGVEVGWSLFKVCREHDNCLTCGINRDDVKERSMFGVKGGSQCHPCHDREMAEKKAAALARVNYEDYDEWDYKFKDDIVCPWCEHQFTDSFEYCHDGNSTEIECHECDLKFEVEPDYTVTYSSTRIEESK